MTFQKAVPAHCVNYFLRPLPVSLRTDTGVSVDSVDALTSVLTLVFFTVIIVQLTVLTNITWSALTPETHRRTLRQQPVDAELEHQYLCYSWKDADHPPAGRRNTTDLL